jgi:hypothetical protein
MPWITLLTGSLAGTAVFAILARIGHIAQTTFWLDPGTVRLTFLPAAAALAFVLRVPFRPLTGSTPVPAWIAQAGHLLLAAPILAATCWAQLRITGLSVPQHTIGDSHEPLYALIAQLTGWSAVTAAAAACAARSRYADLAGAIAAPVSFAAIGLAWYTPAAARFLVEPPGTARGVTIAWYMVAAAALILTCAAMRDPWHRYTRRRPLVATGGVPLPGQDGPA